MNTEIYYFSGTGNSFAVARDIANRTGGTLISIPSVMNREDIRTDADTVGFIFPVYHATFGESGIPLIVRRFITKLKNIDARYLFAVCTHDGMPGATIGNLAKKISSQGGELGAGFTVRMGVPYSAVNKIKHAFFHRDLTFDAQSDIEKKQMIFTAWKRKLNTIQSCINDRKKSKLETLGVITRRMLVPFFLLQKQAAVSWYRHLSGASHACFDDLTVMADKSFAVSEKCNGCRLCAMVCPVKNIKMVAGKPVWQHRCENCFACYQWCPRDAIGGDIVEYEKKYHHPDVTVSDLIYRKEKGV